MRYPPRVTLSEDDRRLLTGERVRPELELRRRIVLLSAEGWFNVDIAAQLGVAVSTVALWRRRFAADGLVGLADRPKPGRPRQVDRTAIVDATLRPRTECASGPLSCRAVAEQLQVSEATVARTWREYGISPCTAGGFAFAVEPRLTASTVDVIGVYLTPDVRVAALVVDDTGSSDGRSAPDGEQAGPEGRSPSSQGLRGYLRRLCAANAGRRIHLVTDDPGAIRMLRAVDHNAVGAELTAHLVVDARTWLNLLEVWFAMTDVPSTADGRYAVKLAELGARGRRAVWLKPVAHEAGPLGPGGPELGAFGADRAVQEPAVRRDGRLS